MPEYIPLSHLSRELREITGKKAPGYQSLYRRIMDGDIPAEVLAHNRWHVRREHLPAIMQTLGLTPREASDD